MNNDERLRQLEERIGELEREKRRLEDLIRKIKRAKKELTQSLAVQTNE